MFSFLKYFFLYGRYLFEPIMLCLGSFSSKRIYMMDVLLKFTMICFELFLKTSYYGLCSLEISMIFFEFFKCTLRYDGIGKGGTISRTVVLQQEL